ncbi:hypothetical protein Tco_0139077 [Tanacetum coccineum]
MKDYIRRRSKLGYIIQQHSTGSSEGSGIIPEVPNEPKDNFGSSSNSLSGSDDEVQDVSSDEKNKADENKADAEVAEKQAGDEQLDHVVQRTSLVDTVISMVTEKSTPTPPPTTTQAQVTNVSESNSSSNFEQRISELEKKTEAMPKRAWTEKDQKQTDEMVQMIDNLLLILLEGQSRRITDYVYGQFDFVILSC